MKIKSILTISGVQYQFDVEEKDDMDALHKIIVISNPPLFCGICEQFGPATKKFDTNKDKEGNIYINIRCKCGAKAKLGQYKSGGYFWHGYEVYKKVLKGETTSDV